MSISHIRRYHSCCVALAELDIELINRSANVTDNFHMVFCLFAVLYVSSYFVLLTLLLFPFVRNLFHSSLGLEQ